MLIVFNLLCLDGAYSDLDEMEAEIKSAQLKLPIDFGDTYSDIDEVRAELRPHPLTSVIPPMNTTTLKQPQEMNGAYSDIDEINEDRPVPTRVPAWHEPQGRELSYCDVDEINSDSVEDVLGPPDELYDTCSLLEKKRVSFNNNNNNNITLWSGMTDAVLQVTWSVVVPRLHLHSWSNRGAKLQHRSVYTL